MASAIRFENVSKMYRLGESQLAFRHTMADWGRALFGRQRKNEKKIFWALRDVSFEVAEGEALGIIGANGAGKTTALKLLSGITMPTEGNIQVNGRTSALIELGAGFHPDFTGRENITLNGAILGLSEAEIKRRFDSIVAFSGLEQFIDTPVKRYSSGMYVRLGFAVAAHVEPRVLLIDEVLAVGDAQFRQRCAQRIEELRGLGTTIVFISHNLPLVRTICDRAIYLEKGQIQIDGDVVEAMKFYEGSLHRDQISEAKKSLVAGSTTFHAASSIGITKVEICDLGDERKESLLPTSPVEIRVHWFAREPVDKPNLVIRFVRADGFVCSMIRTLDHGYSIAESLSGNGVISMIIDPLQLEGGAFIIEVRLLGALDGVPLAKAHSNWFQIGGTSQGHGNSAGVFLPNVTSVQVNINSDGGGTKQSDGNPSE